MYGLFMNDATETLSIKALSFIAEREDLLEGFLIASGMGAHDLYDQADTEEAWAAMLDYILSADEIITDFCDETSYTVQDLWRARNNLPGAPSSACMSA